MARDIGRVVSWKSRSGVARWGVDVKLWPPGQRKFTWKRIYTASNELGTRAPLASEEHAKWLLGLIRGQIVSHPDFGSRDVAVNRAVIASVVAQYLPREIEGNRIKAKWREFLKWRRAEARKTKVTDRRLRDVEAMEKRGYLDFFNNVDVNALCDELLGQWVTWMMDHWLDREKIPGRRRPKLTEEQRAKGVRGFHSAKTRHHIVNDFMMFETWLIRRRYVTRSVALNLPTLPSVEGGRQAVPTIEVVERYLAAIPEDTRGLFLTRSIEGLRPAEARRARVRNYNWQTRVLSITRNITKTKAGVRHFEVDDELAAWLEKWVSLEQRLDPDRPLFINPNALTPAAIASRRRIYKRKGLGEPVEDGHWEEDAEYRVHQRACAAENLVDGDGMPLFPANIMGRHAAITHMLARSKQASGVHDMKATQHKAGHRDERTTSEYVDHAQVDVASLRRLPRKRSESGS